jgi:hypothetical protein
MQKYELPDPTKEPTKCLVISYKVSQGIEYDNRHWDKANFGRCMAAARTLLALCKDLESSETCLRELGNDYDAKGLTWTLETIARNATEWLRKNGRTDANASRARFRLALAERRTEERRQEGLAKVSNGEIFATLRSGEGRRCDTQEDGIPGPGKLDAPNLA